MGRFLIVLTSDREGGGYTVTVPGLPGCVTYGDQVDDAAANAKEAISVYLHEETPERLAAAGVEQEYFLAHVEVPVAS